MDSRALPDLVSRIRVDSTGVDAALMNLVAGVGRAQLALAGLGSAIGLLVIGGKSMLDISQKDDAAQRGLAQAVDYYNANLGKNTKAHREWVSTAAKVRDTAAELAARQLAVARANEAENVAQAAYTRALYSYGPQSDKTMRAELALENAKQRLAAAQAKLNGHIDQATGKWVTVAGTQARARISLADYQKTLETFIADNKAYISDQAQVTDGAGKLIRSGLSQKEVQLDLNRALDLSAIKHISLADAVDLVDQAEHGRYRGLIDLGIATKNYTDANGKELTGAKLTAAVMQDIDKKTAHGRDTLTDYQKKWNTLNSDWQTLSIKGGPVIETLLDTIVTKLSDAYDALDAFGKNDTAWAGISSHLVDIAQAIHDNLLYPLQAVWDAYTGQTLPASPISKNPPQSVGKKAPGTPTYTVGGTAGPGNASVWRDAQGHLISVPPGGTPPPGSTRVGAGPAQTGSSGVSSGNAGRAGGGSVLPNRTYTVGEDDVETLVMGPRGGYVIPGGTSRRDSRQSLTVVVNVHGSVQTERSLHMGIREGLRRLDREHR